MILLKLIENVRELAPQPAFDTKIVNSPGFEGYPVTMSLMEVTDAHIQKVLDHHGGNKTRAARDLGVNVKTIYNRTVARAKDQDPSVE